MPPEPERGIVHPWTFGVDRDVELDHRAVELVAIAGEQDRAEALVRVDLGFDVIEPVRADEVGEAVDGSDDHMRTIPGTDVVDEGYSTR